jgi:hypothetical protein
MRSMASGREFIGMAALAAGTGLVGSTSTARPGTNETRQPWFHVSLAEWSFNRSLFGGKMTNLDFPAVARNEFGIDTVEYANPFGMDKAETRGFDADGVRAALYLSSSFLPVYGLYR